MNKLLLLSWFVCASNFSFACFIDGCDHLPHEDYNHYAEAHPEVSNIELKKLFAENGALFSSIESRKARNKLYARVSRKKKAEKEQSCELLIEALRRENDELRRQNAELQALLTDLFRHPAQGLVNEEDIFFPPGLDLFGSHPPPSFS